MLSIGFQNFISAKSVNFLGLTATKIKLPTGKITLLIGNHLHIIFDFICYLCVFYTINIASPKLKKR